MDSRPTPQLCKRSTLHRAMTAQVRKPLFPRGASTFLMQPQHTTSCYRIKSIPRHHRESQQQGCEIIKLEFHLLPTAQRKCCTANDAQSNAVEHNSSEINHVVLRKFSLTVREMQIWVYGHFGGCSLWCCCTFTESYFQGFSQDIFINEKKVNEAFETWSCRWKKWIPL